MGVKIRNKRNKAQPENRGLTRAAFRGKNHVVIFTEKKNAQPLQAADP